MELSKRFFSVQELFTLHEIYLAWYKLATGSFYNESAEVQNLYSVRTISETSAKEKYINWREAIFGDYIADEDQCPWGMTYRGPYVHFWCRNSAGIDKIKDFLDAYLLTEKHKLYFPGMEMLLNCYVYDKAAIERLLSSGQIKKVSKLRSDNVVNAFVSNWANLAANLSSVRLEITVNYKREGLLVVQLMSFFPGGYRNITQQAVMALDWTKGMVAPDPSGFVSILSNDSMQTWPADEKKEYSVFKNFATNLGSKGDFPEPKFLKPVKEFKMPFNEYWALKSWNNFGTMQSPFH